MHELLDPYVFALVRSDVGGLFRCLIFLEGIDSPLSAVPVTV